MGLWRRLVRQKQEQSSMIKASELKKGKVVLHEGNLYTVSDIQRVSKGNWRSYLQVKLKSLKDGGLRVRCSRSPPHHPGFDARTTPCRTRIRNRCRKALATARA